MKITLKAPTLIFFSIVSLLIVSFSSFKNFDNDIEKCFIKDGETISFSSKPLSNAERTYMSLKVGSYDGSGFNLEIDTVSGVTVSNITQSNGPKPDDFILTGCTGNLKRTKDRLTITLEKSKQKYFLVYLDQAALVEKFDTIFRITVLSKRTGEQSAEYYCHEKERSDMHIKKKINKHIVLYEPGYGPPIDQTIHLTAVPQGVKKDDLFGAKHHPNTLAHFDIYIETTGGRTTLLPQGSYILCEGNSFTLK